MVRLTYRCSILCTGGQKAPPGYIGGSYCVCTCHGWDANTQGSRKFFCGNERLADTYGVDQDISDFIQWLEGRPSLPPMLDEQAELRKKMKEVLDRTKRNVIELAQKG